MPGRTFVSFPPSLEQREGAERRMAHLATCSPCEGEPAALAIGPPRQPALHRGVLPVPGRSSEPDWVLSHPDPGEVLRPPFSPVRKAAPLGARAAALAGRRRTSRYASYSRGCEAPAGWSPLPAPPHDTS